MTTFCIDFYAFAYIGRKVILEPYGNAIPPPPLTEVIEKHRTGQCFASGFVDFGSGSRVLMTKSWKKIYSWKRNLICFWSKIAIDLSLVLHKGRASYRRSLQPPKEHIQHLKTWNFVTFSIFVGNFCPPIWIHWPDWIRIQSGSETLAQASPLRKSSILSLSGSVCLHQHSKNGEWWECNCVWVAVEGV